MRIKIRNVSNNPLPKYQTPGSAGLDIHAPMKHKIVPKPLERQVIPTGLYLELPNGYEGQVRPRTGLAIRKGITVLNAPGTIDCDYRGELGVLLVNLSNESFAIENGDRIAQLVISRSEQVMWDESQILQKSERGSGGVEAPEQTSAFESQTLNE